MQCAKYHVKGMKKYYEERERKKDPAWGGWRKFYAISYSWATMKCFST